MSRLDMAFLGRDRDPVVVKSAARITHDAAWSTLREDAIFVATCLATALVAWAVVALVMAL